MADLDEIDFGADTDAIRKWLAKRATYADDQGDPARGGKHRVDPPGTVDPQQLSVPNSRDAEQDVLAALIAPEPPIASKWPTFYKPGKEPEGAPAEASTDPAAKGFPTPPPRTGTTPGSHSPYASTPEHEEELLAVRSTNAVFKPRTGVRNLITILLVIVAALTVIAAVAAYRDRTNVGYGLLVLFAALTLVVWGGRASLSVTELAVIKGQLEMIRNGKFEIIDLASPYTPVLVEGAPGRHRWRVLIERHDQPLLVLDRSIVDPHKFMAVLLRLRPELRPDAATESGPTPAP